MAGGLLPGAAALAIVFDDARVARVDLADRRVTTRAEPAAGTQQRVPVKGAVVTRDGRVVIAIAESSADRARGLASKLLVIDAVGIGRHIW